GSTIPAVLILIFSPRTGVLSPLTGEGASSQLTRAEARGLRRRGWILLPFEFSNSAMLHSDRLLLPTLSSSAELGLYVTGAAVRLVAGVTVTTVPERQAVRSVPGAAVLRCHRAGTRRLRDARLRPPRLLPSCHRGDSRSGGVVSGVRHHASPAGALHRRGCP